MKNITYLFLLPLVLACGTSIEKIELDSDAYVFENAQVIDVRNGSISVSHVVVEEDKISKILDGNKAYDWTNAKVIYSKDYYLVPGLAEMHAHIPSMEWDDPLIEETLFLYLSNGVTTIRGMLGNPVHLELRDKARKREIVSPRIYTSSPSLNGTTVRTPEEAASKVSAYAADGYDFLKLHPGIRLHVFDEIVRTANEKGIPYAGHVSNLVRIRHALINKYQTIDHVDGFLEGLVPEEANVNPLENGFFGYNFTDLVELEAIDELIALSKENKVWIVPTQALFDRWFSPTPAEELAAEPEMKYMSPETISAWIKSKKDMTETESYTAEKWERFNGIRYKLIKALHENGQGLLLGSDAPQVFNVPGFSIHHELQGMLDAGLTPLEAMQIGTLNPAAFFGGNFGEIKEGMDADLILTEKNPLDNLQHLRNPKGVMARGIWLDQNTISEKLNRIASKYKR
ncbi:Amidohydrolase precursor [Lunatimonas lonarensis]|uniref:Amidohydrolase n=1 Tax=Lunatimonas lonarensis TaxID=1232681 RepID=R7ZR31_9BACT|nr:amidohydrolase family protein [Lunatimonas lonarensis]EON76537.1 Amidohydrolase precursor [Lunatimonas lonarensis]